VDAGERAEDQAGVGEQDETPFVIWVEIGIGFAPLLRLSDQSREVVDDEPLGGNERDLVAR
jgi:hypothetical protein